MRRIRTYLVLYVPVIHEGYISLFQKYEGKVDGFYLLGKSLVREVTFFEKEIRAIHNLQALCRMIESLGVGVPVKIMGMESIKCVSGAHLIMPDEGVSRRIATKYFQRCKVTFEQVFLRWDESHVVRKDPVGYDRISKHPFDQQMMDAAVGESYRASDWWRHIGAMAVRGKRIVLPAHNQHVPSEHLPYALGDIRDFVSPGEHWEVTSALHAEQVLVTEAARRGISLKGASLYITTFPCTVCAKLVAYSGFKRCFYSAGAASFQGQEILKSNKVEIILVKK